MDIRTQLPFRDTVCYFLRGVYHFLKWREGFIILRHKDLPESCKGCIDDENILRLTDDPDFIKFLEKNEEISIQIDEDNYFELSKDKVSNGNKFLYYFIMGLRDDEEINFRFKMEESELWTIDGYHLAQYINSCEEKKICLMIFALNKEKWVFTF